MSRAVFIVGPNAQLGDLLVKTGPARRVVRAIGPPISRDYILTSPNVNK